MTPDVVTVSSHEPQLGLVEDNGCDEWYEVGLRRTIVHVSGSGPLWERARMCSPPHNSATRRLKDVR